MVVLLVFGIWVGGRHPGWLPGPVRGALVGDTHSAVVKEALDRVHDTYYRKIPEDQLADDAIAGHPVREAGQPRGAGGRVAGQLGVVPQGLDPRRGGADGRPLGGQPSVLDALALTRVEPVTTGHWHPRRRGGRRDADELRVERRGQLGGALRL